MKRITRTLLLLIMAVSLLAAFGMTASAAEFADAGEALEYLDGYADYVGSDADFEANIDAALTMVRQDIGGYATFIALLPPIIAIALALITKEVYSSLFIGILSGALIYSNFKIWGMVTNSFDVMVG